ncbi:MAG TPA: DNA repair protein RecO [Bacteroidales bacterium]|nr:DNA repair protein RecO [Bacteroidales bacterium]
MISTTKAIVLKSVKYSESSVIVKMYTELFGLKSFIIRGVRKKHAKISANLLQPLSLVEVVFVNKEKDQLFIPRELSSWYQFTSIPFDVVKSSQAIFINELIYRSVREEETNRDFFNFLAQSIISIDQEKTAHGNTHIAFALQLTRYLGFYPLGSFSPQTPYFLLKDGVFGKFKPADDFFLDQQQSELFYQLLTTTLEDTGMIRLSSELRKKLLEKIIIYYQLHHIGFGEIKSLEVLSQLFHT